MLGAHLNGAQRPRLAPVNGIGRSARPQKAAWRSVAVSKPARRTPPLAAIAEPQQMKVESPDTVLKCVRALQFLAVDATNTAGSGHPGAPMALAPAAYILWNEYMKFNPKNPGLFNRDRFVLSNGHASMLQYGLLHLFGSDVFTVRPHALLSSNVDVLYDVCWTHRAVRLGDTTGIGCAQMRRSTFDQQAARSSRLI